MITTAAWVWLASAGVFAVGDWIAVSSAQRVLEYVCKPATLAMLVGAAIALDPVDDAQRSWFVVALVLSLLGDVFLMLPERAVGPPGPGRRRPGASTDTFTFGLASFLLGHLAYIAGFAALGVEVRATTALALVPLVIAPRVLRAAPSEMRVPVGVYMAVIATMLGFALSSNVGLAILGAALFVSSDAMIGWSRFVREFAHHRVAIIVTYHAAQALLVASLTT